MPPQATPPLVRAAARCAFLSGWVAAVGIVFLALLYAGFLLGVDGLLVFGPLNDLLIVVQYVLAIPVAVALHGVLKPHAVRLSGVALLTAFVGIAGVVVFQVLLLTGAMDFTAQAPYASAFLLVAGAWIGMASHVGRRSGRLPLRGPTVVAAALYVGYPFWAIQVGRQLLAPHGLPEAAAA